MRAEERLPWQRAARAGRSTQPVAAHVLAQRRVSAAAPWYTPSRSARRSPTPLPWLCRSPCGPSSFNSGLPLLSSMSAPQHLGTLCCAVLGAPPFPPGRWCGFAVEPAGQAYTSLLRNKFSSAAHTAATPSMQCIVRCLELPKTAAMALPRAMRAMKRNRHTLTHKMLLSVPRHWAEENTPLQARGGHAREG